jgi:prepilin-type N-terminal cleavage/methylation domain-containing protein
LRHAGAAPAGVVRIALNPLDRQARCEMARALRRGGLHVRSAGFSIIEVLVAMAIVIAGVASLAQLFVASAYVNRVANTTSVTLLLAEQKMEGLLGETRLGSSPPGTLSTNTAGYVDYLDASGVSLALSVMSATPPLGTAYICRWSIAPLPDSPAAATVVQVLVTRWPDTAGQTRLISVKTRKGS